MPKRFADVDSPRSRRRLSLRRLLGMIVLVALVWFLVWVGFYSGLVDPVVQAAKPFYLQMATMINGPLGISWGDELVAAAAVIIPHLVLLAFLFDDTSR